MCRLSLILLLSLLNLEAKLIQRPNGVWFTGKGCGITNEIKYLKDIPKDKDLSCTFVSKTNSPPTDTSKISKIVFIEMYLSYLSDTSTHVYAYDLKTDKARRINHINSLSDCIKECKKESKCKAFTYATRKAQNRFNRRACWLKLGSIEAKGYSVDPEVVSGMIDCTKHPDVPKDAQRYEGPQA